MAISTAAALLGSAALGAAGSLYGASKSASAAKKAGELQYQATQDQIAAQERLQNQIRQDNEPFRQAGLAATNAVLSGFGLSTPSMAAPASGGGYDVNAYIASNPDVAAARGDPNIQRWMSDTGKSFEQWVGEIQLPGAIANGEQRSYPTVQPVQAAPAAGATSSPAGYSDPTATGGYTMTERTPVAPLDVSLSAFHASPDYEFRFSEGEKALGNVTAANRGLMSGARLKAATRYGQNMADSEYTDWRNFVAGQYNADRNFAEAQYQSDRSRLDSRYDTRNNTLLSMAGFGQAANNANQSAAQSFANNSSNLAIAGATARGNAAQNAANAWNQGIGNIMTAGSYLAGQYIGGRTPAGVPPGAMSNRAAGSSASWEPIY
ncbi:MAG TPA: hypothetical protein VIO94_15980 [Phenylobacterium sp.]